jgi:hypothetical protein
MAGVMAALEADDHIRLLAQPIDNLAFSLVAPLGADDHDIRHRSLSIKDADTKSPGTRSAGAYLS